VRPKKQLDKIVDAILSYRPKKKKKKGGKKEKRK